jgi:type IV secretion system protein VirB1
MSASSDGPRDPTAHVVISTTLDDLLVPGVVVELDAREAEEIGALEETALTEADAWEANADLDTDEVRDGE